MTHFSPPLKTDEDRIEYVIDRTKLVARLGQTDGLSEVAAFVRKNQRINELKNSIAIFRKKVVSMELELLALEAE